MNAAVTEEAIRRLPGGVALAFSPYAPRVELLLDQASAQGAGAAAGAAAGADRLSAEQSGRPGAADRALASENGDRLLWALSRFTGYVGAIGALGPMRGERFAQLGEAMGRLQATLHARGLLYVDPRPGATRAGPGLGPRDGPGGGRAGHP